MRADKDRILCSNIHRSKHPLLVSMHSTITTLFWPLFLTGLSDEGQRALDYVSKLPPRVRRLADARDRKQAKKEPVTTKFSWIFDRPVDIIP